MKTVICIRGTKHIGKTTLIHTVFDMLNLAETPPLQMWGNDMLAILNMQGKTVGFASMGDPGSNQKTCLQQLVESGCEVILCASRTKGNTVNAVDNLATHGYRIIWTSPFSSVDTPVFPLNNPFAEAIIKLIQQCLIS